MSIMQKVNFSPREVSFGLQARAGRLNVRDLRCMYTHIRGHVYTKQ